MIEDNSRYNKLLHDIGTTLNSGRTNVAQSINKELLLTKWKIGQHTV